MTDTWGWSHKEKESWVWLHKKYNSFCKPERKKKGENPNGKNDQWIRQALYKDDIQTANSQTQKHSISLLKEKY